MPSTTPKPRKPKKPEVFTVNTGTMTRKIRDAHRETLENATPEERLTFYREGAFALHTAAQKAFEEAAEGGSAAED